MAPSTPAWEQVGMASGGGGFVYQWLGVSVVFLFDGLTFLFSALGVSYTKPTSCQNQKNIRVTKRKTLIVQDVKEGIVFVKKHPFLKHLLLFSLIRNFFMAPLFVLYPFYVLYGDMFAGNKGWYGMIIGGLGLGNVLGFCLVGSRFFCNINKGIWAFRSLMATGIFITSLYFTHSAWLFLLQIIGIGTSIGVWQNYVITYKQTQVPSNIRGRVFAVSETLSHCFVPLATVLGGFLVELFKHQMEVIFLYCGVMITFAATISFFSQNVREHLEQNSV